MVRVSGVGGEEEGRRLGAHRLVWGVIAAVTMLLSSCYRHAVPSRPAYASGTCEAACQHYVDCKGGDAASRRATCVRECRDIFVYEGEPDRDSLRDFERLKCEAAVSFVDGTGRDADASARSQPPAQGRTDLH